MWVGFNFIGFEVQTAVIMKSSIYWDVTLHISELSRCFEEHTASIFMVK
jgi:hypothetical protein